MSAGQFMVPVTVLRRAQMTQSSDGDALTDAIEGTGTTRTSADDPIAQRRGGMSTGERQLAMNGNLGVRTSPRALPDESVLPVREAGSRHWSSALTRSTILQLLGRSITCGLRV